MQNIMQMLNCERCGEAYSATDRQPVIMPDCGHTFCEVCIADLLAATPKQCHSCKSEIRTLDLNRYCKNYQLLQILAAMQGAGPALLGAQEAEFFDHEMYTSCTRHSEKKVEYFCKSCSDTVCARCIFDEHNGHELVQIEDMATSLK